MSVTQKGLVMWWAVGAVMMVVLTASWQFDATRWTFGLKDLSILIGWVATWGYILVRLTTVHKNSKQLGAAK
jgi:hypothetical protein